MPDWNYQHYQGINPGLLEQQVNAPSKYATGLNALMSGLNPGMQQAISSMIQKNQLQQILASMNGGQQQQQQQQPQFPQGQQSAMPPQMGMPGSGTPDPFQQSIAKNTGMYGGPLSLGGNDPMGLFS